MTPERARVVLAGLAGSLQLFVEEIETFESKCPEARHLKLSIMQCQMSLSQLIARDEVRE